MQRLASASINEKKILHFLTSDYCPCHLIHLIIEYMPPVEPVAYRQATVFQVDIFLKIILRPTLASLKQKKMARFTTSHFPNNLKFKNYE